MFYHHASPACDPVLVQHVLDRSFGDPRGGCGTLPLAISMVLVLDDDTLECLDIVYDDIGTKVSLGMEKVRIWFQIEMECGIEGRELEPDGVVPGDDVWVGAKDLVQVALGERLIAVEVIGRCSGEDVVAQTGNLLRSSNGWPGLRVG